MKDTEKNIKNFYSQLRFPGSYTMDDLQGYSRPTGNYYLDVMERYVAKADSVLDAGCGSGLVTNFMAHRWPNKRFVGMDFSDAVLTAREFAQQHNIGNVNFQRQDLVKLWSGEPHDLIICQGVLHHIPRYHLALHNLLYHMSVQGIMLLGVYHPWGKWLQKTSHLVYESVLLRVDQTENPFERSFDLSALERLLPDHNVKPIGPTVLGSSALASLVKAKSGAIVIYEITHR